MKPRYYTVTATLRIEAATAEDAMEIASSMCFELNENHPHDETDRPWLDSWTIDGVADRYN